MAAAVRSAICGRGPCGSGSLPASGPPRCINDFSSPPSRAEPAPTVWGRTLWERVSARERASTVYQCLRSATFAGRARSHSVGANPVGAGLCPRTGLHGVSVPPHRRLRGQSPLPQCGANPVGAGLCPRTGLRGVSVPPHRCLRGVSVPPHRHLRGQSPLPQCGRDPCGRAPTVNLLSEGRPGFTWPAP